MEVQPPTSGSPFTGGFDSIRPDDEMLVAYLDGELDPQGVDVVESKLSGDAHLRRRLDDLRSAWDLLEELPIAVPGPKFAQTTIEMVAMSASSLAEEKSKTFSRWGWWAAGIAIVPVLFALGYGGTRSAERLAERKAIADLPLLADLESLQFVGTYDWLKELRSVQFLDRVTKRSSSGLSSGVVPEAVTQRRTWIEGLSSSDRDRLSDNLDKFKRLDARERQRIVDLAEKIYSGPDPLGDLQIARDYAHFLNDMSINDRIVHSDTQDATARLDDLVHRVNRKMLEVYSQELTADSPDRERVLAWMDKMVEQYGNLLPPAPRMGFSSSTEASSNLNRVSVVWDLYRRLGGGDSVIGDDDLAYLQQSLTPEAQAILSRLRTTEAQTYALILYFVIDASPAMGGSRSRPYIGRAQLTERFSNLPESQKVAYEFMTPETAQDMLGATTRDGRNRPIRNNISREERIEQSEKKATNEPK